ncbi:delta 8-(E)-sphingolipid desaturase 2 [Cladorrhinum samala]|uniref:Delta 8-(E)-sphingolipid desaturase n=1 Tax=Cladorrhinum samala TaxID=585594 RepID=A0AAV9HVP0_9PEZI|nr:delta 8-(E)-sphingolipid desaturase 2 [Cladorrhinum samala]
MSGRDRTITPCEVHDLIADGHIIVIYQDYVLKLDSWLEKHPGGTLAILHMVGKDATDEIDAYHRPPTLKTMGAFRIGRKPPGLWPNSTPPIRGGVYTKRDPLPSVTISSADDDVEVAADEVSDSESSSVNDSASVVSEKSMLTSYTSDEDSGEKPRPGLKVIWKTADDASKTKVFNGDKAAYTEWAMEQEVEKALRDYPSVDPKVQVDIQKKYRALHQRIYDEGLYNCPYLAYGKELARYSLLFSAFLVALRSEWYMTSACFLGLFWHQIMFTAHDAGHRAITGNFEIDSLIGMFIADFCCGLSIGWWKSSHNVHHLITNHPQHDPDIQNTPLFATCPSFFKSLHSSYYNFTFVWDKACEILVPYQKYTYYPVMGIARFNLYLLSWLHVISSRSSGLGNSKAWWIRPTEIAFMSCYWYIFGYLLLWCTLPTWTIRVAFVLVSHIITMPLHVQITLSHWGMSTSELGESESFAQRQLRTTMDVDCPAWLDFIHGGLQFQSVHHLFPRAPRHNLRKIQKYVMEFCEETGVPYTLLGFVDGNKHVISRLHEVGEQVGHLVNCQKYMASTGESGLH